nr:hypothetical protein [Tanacetum cinerariifolium]
MKFGVEELVPILSENKVTLEDKRECDVLVCEKTLVCDDHSDIFFDSKIDDNISVYDEYEDIEYVEASLSNPKIFKTRSGNTTHANDSLPEYDSFCFEIEPGQERLINVMKNDISEESTNDPLLEENNLFLASDNSIPSGIENFADDSEGDIRFLKELLIDDSILSHESSDSNFEDNPSIPRPPIEPPDDETDTGKEISVVMNDKDEDVDYSCFIFVIYPEMFSLLLSAESEDTIFDPGISD